LSVLGFIIAHYLVQRRHLAHSHRSPRNSLLQLFSSIPSKQNITLITLFSCITHFVHFMPSPS
jgi:hypothetical protein